MFYQRKNSMQFLSCLTIYHFHEFFEEHPHKEKKKSNINIYLKIIRIDSPSFHLWIVSICTKFLVFYCYERMRPMFKYSAHLILKMFLLIMSKAVCLIPICITYALMYLLIYDVVDSFGTTKLNFGFLMIASECNKWATMYMRIP